MLRSNSSAEGDGPPSALQAESDDVASSPPSMGVSGSRAASLTEEPPPPPVKWDDVKVKLMCSCGGRILPRPHDNQLRYVGGESRIMVVSRSVTFAELTSKLSRMFGVSVVVKYQLPNEDLDALISVTSDEDLENMMEEYDRLQSTGSRRSSTARLRLFLFPLKLARSTASVAEVMDKNNSPQHLFVDMLNSMPTLPRMRSETSSNLSETPDYQVQGNMDVLEEWAAASSYVNSRFSPQVHQAPECKQPNIIPTGALVGSLLQHSGPGEVISSSPLTSDFLSSTPAISSAMADFTSKGQPTTTQHAVSDVDLILGVLPRGNGVGSGGATFDIPEQKKHVYSEILLPTDKNVFNNSAGAAEQLSLPTGLTDDHDMIETCSANGSFDEVKRNRQNVPVDECGILTSVLQPIFDEEVMSYKPAQNLQELHLEEKAPSTPSARSSASGLDLATTGTPQRQLRGVATSKHQVVPSIPQAIAQSSGEDKLMEFMEQNRPALADMANPKPGGEDDYSASLAHLLSPLDSPQEFLHLTPGEDTLLVQLSGINSNVVGQQPLVHVQAPSLIGGSPAESPSLSMAFPTTLHPLMVQPVAPISNYSPEIACATSYTMQAPASQPPVIPQVLPLTDGASSPIIAAPSKITVVTTSPNMVAATGISHTRLPQSIAPTRGVCEPLLTEWKTTFSASSVPPIVASSTGEALKVISPTASHLNHTVVPSMADGAKGIPSIPYQKVEVAQVQRQVNEPQNQRAPAQLSNNYPSVTPTSGVPSHFRAVGRPMQQFTGSIPVQQPPIVGVFSDKKGPIPAQRAVAAASAQTRVMSAGTQFGYYVVDQSNAIAQPTLMGGVPVGHNAPSTLMTGIAVTSPGIAPFVGGNPFVDNLEPVSVNQDVLGLPPADQQHRHQMRS